MSIKTKAQSYKQVADEAVFQVDCGREFADWMFALMTAIRDDHKHSAGRNSAGLSNLGVYLSETHQADTEQAFEQLTENLLSLGGAK
ncbi:hypothetical protein [Pseudomonas sp. B21-053]|uniref:hypothetical protein n=1 Tax=Pseudomonas sp. B21-053 TaxID=2895493 RepID=UPI00223037C2|nr:hypothetical protein [Pseudomonas sp. B21-053]UZE10534.1 hypothetical protein LOY68_23990 [Pseudomonas sp. B21-053]